MADRVPQGDDSPVQEERNRPLRPAKQSGDRRHLHPLEVAQLDGHALRYLQGMKVAAIAGLLGRSEGAVSLLLHRAVVALRDTVGHPGDEV